MKVRFTRAFTLVELVIVMTILVLLIAILLPSLAAARSQGRKAQCAVKLHNMGTAIMSRQAQLKLPGLLKTCGLYDLPAYMNNDPTVFTCPEDTGAPLTINNAQLAAYHGTHVPANFYYYMPLQPTSWCWKSTNPSLYGGYSLDWDEDPQPNSYGYYDYYVEVDPVAGGVMLSSLKYAASFDTKPSNFNGGSWGPGTTIAGDGASFDLVDLQGTVLLANWTVGDSRTYMLPLGGCSYGMSYLYPSGMTSPTPSTIIIQDYLQPVTSVSGTGAISGEWHDNLLPDPAKVGSRPGLARHRGRFNALYMDCSVQTDLVPKMVGPDLGTTIRQKWWGGI